MQRFQRVSSKVGSRIANSSLVLLGGTRLLGYSGILGAYSSTPNVEILGDGIFLTVYAALWGIVTVAALLDFIKGVYGFGVLSVIPVLFWWGLSYLIAWVVSPEHGWAWLSVALYISYAGAVLGLLASFLAERQKNQEFITHIENTTALPVVSEEAR